MSIAIVVGSLAPYVARVYEAFAERHREDLHVFACAGREPHRAWDVPDGRNFHFSVLPGLRWHRHDASHVYANPAIVARLARLRPEVMAIAAFSPTMALAVAYARLTGTPYGVATDGTLESDPGLGSTAHAAMRRLLVPGARFGMGASDASLAMLEHWGLRPGRGTVVPVVPAWEPPAEVPGFAERPFDVLLAGGINDRFKGVLFFAEVMERLVARGHRLRIRVTGKGPLREELAARLSSAGLEAHFDGAVQPADMAAVMASARLFMFPSRQDPWGLVANEAVLCGTPVLGSPHAASSRHFVERFGVGLVRPLEVEAWCDAVIDMLSDEARWQRFMARRQAASDWASLDSAVEALGRAFAVGRGAAPQPAAASPAASPAER